MLGSIFKRKRHIEARIKGIQRTLERVDSLALHHSEQSLQHEFNDILFQEELLWFQKSRGLNWETRIQPTFVLKLLSEGGGTKSKGSLSLMAFGPQMKRYSNLKLKTILKTYFGLTKSLLLNPVSKEEVLGALNTMKPFKAPRPDGFQAVFFKQYWNIVGQDIKRMMNEAFSCGKIDPALLDTLIALVPKVDCPKTFKDFRPISLCNTIYKILTKVLVHRIRPILCNLIGPFQSSFLPGRDTTDNAIVLQEIVYAMKMSKKKKGEVAYKIGLEKAYDHVDWDFLRGTLSEFGFPGPITNLIMSCVTKSSLSLLWNGKRLPSFSPTRGLRQGDPFSPYLFVFCTEKISLAIQSEVCKGNWSPFKVP